MSVNQKQQTPMMSELQGYLDILNDIVGQVNHYNKERMEYYGVTEDFCEFLETLSEDEIEELTLQQVNSYLAQYGVDSDTVLSTFAKGDNSVSTIDKWKEFFRELKTASMDLNEMKETRAELRDAINGVYDKQAEYLRSDEYLEAYNRKISKIRELAEAENDPVLRAKYVRKLDALKNSTNLTFLLERLDDPKINAKNPNKELFRLVDIFFSYARGNYAMERYHNTVAKLGVNAQFHTNLYNIEEDFLPEYFHPLNNFFLFMVMNYIAYVDPNNDIERLYAITILSTLGNLRMNMIGEAEKTTVLNIIRNVENRLTAMDDVMEKFKSDNTTWKEHPVRKELDAKRAEMETRNGLLHEISEAIGTEFGFHLTDGTSVTRQNLRRVLSSMSTEQIENIKAHVLEEKAKRDAEKAEEPEEDVIEPNDDKSWQNIVDGVFSNKEKEEEELKEKVEELIDKGTGSVQHGDITLVMHDDDVADTIKKIAETGAISQDNAEIPKKSTAKSKKSKKKIEIPVEYSNPPYVTEEEEPTEKPDEEE